MTTSRIIYEGPVSLAVPTARMLADAEGVELTSQTGDRRDEAGDLVRLALVLEGPGDAIRDAVTAAQDALPPGATMTIAETTDDS